LLHVTSKHVFENIFARNCPVATLVAGVDFRHWHPRLRKREVKPIVFAEMTVLIPFLGH